MSTPVGRALGRLALATASLAAVAAIGAAAASAGTVLILSTSVSGGAGSYEAQAAVAAGHGVEIATPAQWAAKTAADFATYDALILGDPTCGGTGTGPWIGAAEANRTVWSPTIDGNVVVIGTDEVYHHFQGGAQLTTSAVKFASDAAGRTGLMVSLSCYYHGTAPLTPVPVLDQFGTGFKTSGVGCYNDAHIVATHPALTGLTDAALSGWGCSVHEAISAFPSDFLPLAIARNITGPGSMSFPDGSFGIPYILARGEGLVFISDIMLTPLSATNPVGTAHTVTATVVENGTPVAGATVTFTVVSGPHAGTTGTAVTSLTGVASFTYTGTTAGVDTIEATYVDSRGILKRSNQARKEWTAPLEADIQVTKTDSADPVDIGDDVTYTVTVSNAGPAGATNVTMTDSLPLGATFVSASASQGSCGAPVGGLLTCSLGGIAAGGSATVQITVHPTGIGTLIDKAHAEADQPDPELGNNGDDETTEVVDRLAPAALCFETTNPSGKNVPTSGPNAGKSGQNPDGYYRLLGGDNVAVASIVVRDSGSSFVSDPFANDSKVKITQAPGVTPSDNRPGPGVIVSHLKLKGDAILRVTDTSGNFTEVWCRVAPPPK